MVNKEYNCPVCGAGLVFANNPTIVKSKKGEKRFYLKIERDEDIIEKV